MMQVNQRPLLTAALYAHNEAPYIREAVHSTLAQTYRPLQIILSDDCSTDETYSIMQAVARHYGGPHEIVLNRTSCSKGVAAHVNSLMALAKGVLVLAFHGDDIALPDRCELTWRAWERAGRRASSIAMGFKSFSEDSSVRLRDVPVVSTNLEEVIWNATTGVIGASYAWHRRLFEVFGPLPEFAPVEDVILPFRSLLLDGIVVDRTPVVNYRCHSGNYLSPHRGEFAGLRGARVRMERKLKAGLANLQAFAATVEQAFSMGLISSEKRRVYLDKIAEAARARQVDLDLTSPQFRKRVRAALQLWTVRTISRYSVTRKVFWMLNAFLPALSNIEYKVRDRNLNPRLVLQR